MSYTTSNVVISKLNKFLREDKSYKELITLASKVIENFIYKIQYNKDYSKYVSSHSLEVARIWSSFDGNDTYADRSWFVEAKDLFSLELVGTKDQSCMNFENKITGKRFEVLTIQEMWKELTKIKLAYIEKYGVNANQITEASAAKNQYLYKGHVITASCKKEAIRKILQRKVVASSSKNKEIFLVKCLRKAVDENFIREHSKEIEDIFDKYFWWNSKEKQYEYEIYKDYSDTLDPWWFEHHKVYSFDAYWDALFESYMDVGNEQFNETLDSLVELCEDNGVEIDEDVAKDYIIDYVPVEYPDFLNDEIDVTLYIDANKDTLKMVFGTDSIINISNKFVKGNLRQDLQDSIHDLLLDCHVSKEEQKNPKKVYEVLDEELTKGTLCGCNTKITVEQFLSIQEPDDDRACKFIDLDDYMYLKPDAYYGSNSEFNLKAKIPTKYFDSNYTDVGHKDF